MTKAILMDIEGTTTSISFVHDVLFPYSKEHLPRFIREHAQQDDVSAYLKAAAATIREEGGSQEPTVEETIATLLRWIATDRKHPALKGLQGLIWEFGYKAREYTSHLYDDVPPTLKAWQKAGLKLAIYSSGSVQAQKLLFGHTTFGDFNPLFAAYFDTEVGAKREPASYVTIARTLGEKAGEILFLSDVPEELDAAKTAGMQTLQLLRPGTAASPRHMTVKTFADIKLPQA